MIPSGAKAVGLDVSLLAGVSMGIDGATVGDTVIDDTGVTEGARVTSELGVDSEYVTFLTASLSQK